MGGRLSELAMLIIYGFNIRLGFSFQKQLNGLSGLNPYLVSFMYLHPPLTLWMCSVFIASGKQVLLDSRKLFRMDACALAWR